MGGWGWGTKKSRFTGLASSTMSDMIILFHQKPEKETNMRRHLVRLIGQRVFWEFGEYSYITESIKQPCESNHVHVSEAPNHIDTYQGASLTEYNETDF